MVDQTRFQFPLPAAFGHVEEVEDIRILERLLDQVGVSPTGSGRCSRRAIRTWPSPGAPSITERPVVAYISDLTTDWN